jgi:hypothetical protein
MIRHFGAVLIAALVVIGWNLPGYAITPIPQESGISGFINIGLGGISVESNMVAGNSLVDIGKKSIDSIFDSPDSESDLLPVLNGELAYTFGSTRTQIYIGNSFEDFIRFEAASLIGLRQELEDQSILAVSYIFSGIVTEVWEDPYVQGRNRSKTDRDVSGLRLGYDKILGSDFELEFTWRTIDLDDERSGLTQLVPGEVPGVVLTAAEAGRLDREGDSYELEVLYPFRFQQGQHILAPSLAYTHFDLDGDAMANDRYQVQLTYFYTGDMFDVAANALYAYADYDKTNPIYGKTREDDVYGGSLALFYKNLLDVEKLSLVGTVAGFKSDANIDFYETTVSLFTLSVLYRF